jgi:hypothetical protein
MTLSFKPTNASVHPKPTHLCHPLSSTALNWIKVVLLCRNISLEIPVSPRYTHSIGGWVELRAGNSAGIFSLQNGTIQDLEVESDHFLLWPEDLARANRVEQRGMILRFWGEGQMLQSPSFSMRKYIGFAGHAQVN